MFVERSTQYTSLSSRKQPANAGTERKQFTENASVALQQPILTHAHTKCPPVLRACLHGGGGPQIGAVTCGGSPTYHVNVIKLK